MHPVAWPVCIDSLMHTYNNVQLCVYIGKYVLISTYICDYYYYVVDKLHQINGLQDVHLTVPQTHSTFQKKFDELQEYNNYINCVGT